MTCDPPQPSPRDRTVTASGHGAPRPQTLDEAAAGPPAVDPAAPRPTVAAGLRGVVAAGHPATRDAALAILDAGGNAFDAAVAAGFAAAVAEPCLSSLGGGGFLLAQPADGEPEIFDFFVDTPGRGRPAGTPLPELTPVTLRFGGAEQVFHVGSGSVAVPGGLAGYLAVHEALGTLDLAEIVEPARRLAVGGVVLGPDQAAVVRLLEPIFSLTAEAREMFVPGDRPFGDDEVVVNEPLGAFLAEVAARRVRSFGDPGVADAIAGRMAADDGALTLEDLQAYEVVRRSPLQVSYRDANLITNPPPSFGGTLIGRALARLEAQGQLADAGSAQRLHQVATALDAVTREHLGLGPRASKGTTHVSVADAEGNLAAMTTSNGSGSGIVLGDTGVLANNIMGEEDLHPGGFHRDQPGVRVGSMMAPTVLRRGDGPPIAMGSGGSERIRSALTQVIVALVDDHLTLPDAVAASRLHVVDGVVQLEPGFDPDSVAGLAGDWPVNEWDVTDLYFGGVHAVAASGERAGDHRRGGCTGIVTG